uniref:Uncharacterized protein n=1 Tax=Chromera velia CCMP2878 TaxID=1169474 RepID=A0A0G4HLX6_9ALVE|eukprot:Cvel_28929.t1-p1 / transcript=Cvel_28929.t1 / gene=Cvel_28929 / organism=Chromera_velia_CCMP2878 / gene_product=hypothetical protein / transcript_product=hypothetical protein / location=Cvel_scaffold3874:308-991(-) / protein_length=228 / sequence_SO=supercontig / SO=protein_coding / is_pseudo=false
MMSSHAASSKASKGGQRDRRIGFTPVISQPKQKQKQMRKGQRALGAVRVSKGLQVNQQKITDRRKLETIAHRIAKVGGGDWNTDRLRLKGVSIKKKAKALSTIKLTLTAERWARQRHANRIRQERERKTGGLPEETALSSSSVCRLPPVPEEEVWEPVTVSSDEEGDRKEFAVLSKQNKWLRPFAFRRLRERMKLFESEFLSSSPGTGSASKGGRQKGQQDVFVDQVR